MRDKPKRHENPILEEEGVCTGEIDTDRRKKLVGKGKKKRRKKRKRKNKKRRRRKMSIKKSKELQEG
jgi:hypothetical protein